MNNYAVIQRGKVVNIIVWDGDETVWQPPKGCQTELLSDGVRIDIDEAFGDGSSVDSSDTDSMSP
ncbi:hypothetical protein KPB04_27735 [Burkholderia cenocepacia]|uniref:hypothetical protein n=1 Tax=Burkholderia cenocepacia TaxID=95486 RepID=UPI002858B4A4|nr:hypothetical protein [Burkholderia cenocepacia]MDR8105529.1 hypothetical protein [Burkholderia cenocepacia]